jgi:hypothetical protein
MFERNIIRSTLARGIKQSPLIVAWVNKHLALLKQQRVFTTSVDVPKLEAIIKHKTGDTRKSSRKQQKKTIASNKWRSRNRKSYNEKCRIYQADWRKKNAEYIRAYHRLYRPP